MWHIYILAIMVSAASVYALTDNRSATRVQTMRSADLAASMAIYRMAVVSYVNHHPEFSGSSVPDAALAATLPAWYVGNPLWRNHVSPKRKITIYAAALPAVKISADIASLSRNSLLAGEARTATNTLYSPVFGNTVIPLPSGVSIPNGAPVWMAQASMTRENNEKQAGGYNPD